MLIGCNCPPAATWPHANKNLALPYIEWVNIQMLATEVTENTEVFSFVGAASAANSSRSDGLFAAKAAPTFTVVQIKTTK